jgi:hypothetical protein
VVAPSRTRLRWLRFALPAALLIGLVGFYQLYRSGSPATGPIYLPPLTVTDPASLPGIQTGQPPWGAGIGGLRERLRALGLPALGSEGTALHTHEHLDVFVHGRSIIVPANIGIDRAAGFISPLHTHDESGVIHVESPTMRTFSLGQFFDVWGVRFTRDCLGGLCNTGSQTLRVFVDGHEATGDPRRLELFAHEEIVVAFGTAAELPSPIPHSYGFHLLE